MMKVNDKSKTVLEKIFKLVSENDKYIKLNNNPIFMSLTVEIIEDSVISLCHYGEQNGDLMRDPEMLFWVENGNYYPFYFRNDYVGVEEYSGEIIGNKLIINNTKLQNDHRKFSNMWLQNIKYQQNI